eukprot:4276950-Heterocapsa_arctica.AAC.1
MRQNFLWAARCLVECQGGRHKRHQPAMQQVVGVPKRLQADVELPDDRAGVPSHRLQTPLERIVR